MIRMTYADRATSVSSTRAVTITAGCGNRPTTDRLPEHREPGQGGHVADDSPAARQLLGEFKTVHTHRQLIETFVLYLAAAGLGRHTIRVRRRHLLDLASVHPDLLAVSTSDLAAWLAEHAWQHSARAQARATLRLFYGWAYDEGLLEKSPAWRLPKVRHPRPTSKPAPLGVIAAALLKAQPRERRMILVARYSGLRRAEVAQLHSHDVTELGSGAPALHVRGKGTHERLIPLHPVLAETLDGLHGFLFPSERHPSGHLDPDTVGRCVSALLGPGWSMHSLRHRAANDWLAVTGDILAVSKLLGHANVAITQTYLLDDEAAMTRAVLGVA